MAAPTINWPLLLPPAPNNPPPVFSPGQAANAAACVTLGRLVSFAQADFLDLLDRLLPFDYLSPLKLGTGYEIYEAQAAIGARVSAAIGNFQLASSITTAPDGCFAQAQVLFSRATATAGALTIKAGTVVQTARYGRQFSLIADVSFGAADLSVSGIVQALYTGEQYNVAGPYTTARGELVPGEINQIVTWVQSPAFADPTVTVSQSFAATGGDSSVLNLHGSDRGFTRAPGELASSYRQRIRQLPDTVSPQAMQNALAAYATIFPGTTWDFIETFSPTFQEAYDCPTPNASCPNFLPIIPQGIDTNLFVYDDPRPAYPPFRNRWLSEVNYRGAFIVTVPNLAALFDVGFAYDDTAETPAALQTVNGRRAVPAYDVPQNYAFSLQGYYDGADYQKMAVYAGLYQTLQRIKGGGIFVSLELQGQ